MRLDMILIEIPETSRHGKTKIVVPSHAKILLDDKPEGQQEGSCLFRSSSWWGGRWQGGNRTCIIDVTGIPVVAGMQLLCNSRSLSVGPKSALRLSFRNEIPRKSEAVQAGENDEGKR